MRKFHILSSVALAFSLFFTLGTTAMQAQDGSEFAGGNGTKTNPWQIATKQQLAAIDNYKGEVSKGKYFILTQDLDFTDDFSRSGAFYNDGKFWLPLCAGSDFQGTLDGNNHEIIGLRVNSNESGLFGAIKLAVIENLTVSYGKVDLPADPNFSFGGIANYAENSVIENCHVKSDEYYGITAVSGGGLIRSCGVDVYVIGSSFVGELKGKSYDGTGSGEACWRIGGLIGGGPNTPWNGGGSVVIIENSFVEGNISSVNQYQTGGLIGNGGANIYNCHVKGNIINTGGANIGGLVGDSNDGYYDHDGAPVTIEKSYFQGNITGGALTGGLIGDARRSNTHITTSYADGKIQGRFIAGGLIGTGSCADDNPEFHINESYSKGEIEVGEQALSFAQYIAAGGIIGCVANGGDYVVHIEDCYSHCNIDVSFVGIVCAGGLVGVLSEGWDYINGGIFGVEIQNSYAMGKIEGDQGPTSQIYGVRHAYLGGLISAPRLVSPQDSGRIISTFASVKRCVAMNPSLTAPHGDIEDTGRIGVFDTSDLSNNYALNTMVIKIGNKDVTVTGTANDKNGQDKTAAELAQQSTYTGLGWNFRNIWKMSVNGYPIFIWEEDTPIATAPTIITQPISQTVNEGSSVTFSVTATGTEPLSYQWYKDSTPISGATGSSYTIGSAKTSDEGSYFVIVSNSVGNAVSSVATLTVIESPKAPVIIIQPASQTVDVGQQVTFSVVATGTEPLNYQWLKNGATIPGATKASYTITSAKMEDAGNYMVIVSNSAGVAVSNSATLTVKNPAVPPVIIVQPMSQEVLIGESVTFSVVATGTEPLSYQWLFNGNPIPGATSATYYIGQVTEANAGNYSVIVSNVAGTVVSSTAVLTVKILPPVIMVHPQTQIIMKGSTATFAVIAEGYGLSYQWTFNGKDIAGANQPVYMIPAAEAGNVGSYAVKVSNKAGSVTSQSAMLWLNNLQMYAGVEVYGPIGAKFTVWYKDDAESGEWKKLTSSTVSASPTVVIDYDSPQNKKRFYKVEIE